MLPAAVHKLPLCQGCGQDGHQHPFLRLLPLQLLFFPSEQGGQPPKSSPFHCFSILQERRLREFGLPMNWPVTPPFSPGTVATWPQDNGSTPAGNAFPGNNAKESSFVCCKKSFPLLPAREQGGGAGLEWESWGGFTLSTLGDRSAGDPLLLNPFMLL